jgi:hypothetical protein
MKQILKLTMFLFIASIFISCARVESPKLPPNHLIDEIYMDIHSPNQEGWSKISHSNFGITFGKYGKKYNETYIARVIFFKVEKTNSDKEFLELLSQDALKSTNKKRFDLLESDIQYEKQRKYPCILVKILSKDKMATTTKGNKEKLLMKTKALYCKDPKNKNNDSAFMIGYSYRGEKANSSFDMQADSFLNGVEFPEYKSLERK